MNRMTKIRQLRPAGQPSAELENTFILKLPKGPADALREAIRQGRTDIKDRLFIQLEYAPDKDDMRNGIITFDTLMYKARLVDTPTIIESWKSIDGKNFYKTADICQMLMVREGEDPPEEEDCKKKKRDPLKVDKKYLWPHGYTPPLKNIRKRRFRKTLRKKNLDLPDIEKEVKRLLRTDNEAVSVKWEVVHEEDEKKHASETNISSSNLDEQLFGEVVSSSEDDVGPTINILDEDEDSRLSVEDSQFSEQNENAGSPPSKVFPTAMPSSQSSELVTQFSSSMFKQEPESPGKSLSPPLDEVSLSAVSMSSFPSEPTRPDPDAINKLYARLSHLESEMSRLLSHRAVQEAEIASIENNALRQKFLSKLADIEEQIQCKEAELMEVKSLLND